MGWPVQVVDTTGSTNADLAALARTGDTGPRVLAARAQTAGRGRLGRQWQSAPGASVSLSVLWRPRTPQQVWTWLPMVLGLGVLDALRELGVGAAQLKWPNDVLVPALGRSVADDRADDRADSGADDGADDGALTGLAKLAGILVEVVAAPGGPVVVAGVGLNLRTPAGNLGVSAASLDTLRDRPQHPTGRDVATFDAVVPVLAAALQERLLRWDAVAGAPEESGVREEYVRACSTLGRRVRVTTPGGVRAGTAVGIGADGSLVLQADPTGDDPTGHHPPGAGAAPERVEVSAGDVEHVR